MKPREHLNMAMGWAEKALERDVPIHMEERAEIERDYNLVEARQALIALIEDARANGWSQLEVNRLKAALEAVERRT